MCHTLIPQAQNTAARLCGRAARGAREAGRTPGDGCGRRAKLERPCGSVSEEASSIGRPPRRCAAYHRDLQSKACDKRAAQPATPFALMTRRGHFPATSPVLITRVCCSSSTTASHSNSAHLCPALPTGTFWSCYSLKRQGHLCTRKKRPQTAQQALHGPAAQRTLLAQAQADTEQASWTPARQRGLSQRRAHAHRLAPARAHGMRACS